MNFDHDLTDDPRRIALDPERGRHVPATAALDRLADQEADALPERKVFRVGGAGPSTITAPQTHDLGELRREAEDGVERLHSASYGPGGQLPTHAEAEAAVKAARESEAGR
jgi:hypothetical protein